MPEDRQDVVLEVDWGESVSGPSSPARHPDGLKSVRGRGGSDIAGVTDCVCLDSSIAATSSRSSCESRACMPLRSATASRHAEQLAMCASNSRRSAADSMPTTYAASHMSYQNTYQNTSLHRLVMTAAWQRAKPYHTRSRLLEFTDIRQQVHSDAPSPREKGRADQLFRRGLDRSGSPSPSPGGSRGHILGTLGHKPGESQRITHDVISQVNAVSAL